MSEEYKKGSIHTELFYEMIKNFGWKKITAQDENIDCSVCPRLCSHY